MSAVVVTVGRGSTGTPDCVAFCVLLSLSRFRFVAFPASFSIHSQEWLCHPWSS